MPRSEPEDLPGARHHITNRGIAKRAMFDNTRDVRTFLAALAAAVRRREIRVLADGFMTAHFHPVVESNGRLAQATARVQRDDFGWFNRGRRRDGSLVRERFRSKRISSASYLRRLIGDVDRNLVVAKIVAKLWDFPHGSASAFHTGRFPRWLDPPPVARVFTGDDR